jgi:hypothetical protein
MACCLRYNRKASDRYQSGLSLFFGRRKGFARNVATSQGNPWIAGRKSRRLEIDSILLKRPGTKPGFLSSMAGTSETPR